MWWRDVAGLAEQVSEATMDAASGIAASVIIEPGACLDTGEGPIIVGPRTKICSGAIVRGPVVIGADCLIGNNALVRGPSKIGDGVVIGYGSELKRVLIADAVSIGPLCFLGDTRVDEKVYLGAMVRTSNHRLDRQCITVRQGEEPIETGMEKLGCWIGARSSLGVMVIVLPGRVIAPDTQIEPRITVKKNLPAGHYRLMQTLMTV